MRTKPPLVPCLFLAAASFSTTAALGSRWEARLIVAPQFGMALRSQSSGEEGEGNGKTSQRIRKLGDSYSADYGFTNFNNDQLSIHFQVKKPAFDAYDAEWGYKPSDLDAIKAWHENARQGAYKYAVSQKKSQSQLDAAMNALQAEYDRKVKEYMASRGFNLQPGNIVEVDMPALVKKNSRLLAPLASSFEKLSQENGYDSENLVGAVTSMVQTAVLYRIPPPVVNGVHTGGLLPPVKTLVVGWGDCDTKTGLLASILANWPHMRMVGVSLPEHYLMGILRIPNKGDLFVEYDGLQYVLIEPAGPAWLTPGQLGIDTVPMLEAQQGYKIEPFF